MTDGVIEAVLRRDRAIVAAALFVLAGLAWAYVLWLAAGMDMGGMDMSGFRMIPAGVVLMMPANVPWNATEFAFVFAMWAVMMVGMMTPSATPMILIYTRWATKRHNRASHSPPASGLQAAIFLPGSVLLSSRRLRNGRWNARACLRRQWQP